MSPERMERIEALYSETLLLPAEDRKAFLERACGDDIELRREIESLLGFQQQAETYMVRTAFHMVAQSLSEGPGVLVDRMLGRYQLLSLVGRGGMSEVYCAVDSRLNRLVAVKVLPGVVAGDRERLELFEQEARAAAGLNHPYICTLFDVGNDGETHYLVFEYLVGQVLSERLSKGALPFAEALEYSTQIAEALSYAHDQGIIHLDLKPQNIMLLRNGVKLLDFGISELRDPGVFEQADTSANTSSPPGRACGTLGYMSPEQLEGRETDCRTDIFALGVVMYEMFTGQSAFPNRRSAQAAALNLKVNPPRITSLQPDVPPALEMLVERCLCRRPSERWQSVPELLSQLHDCRNR